MKAVYIREFGGAENLEIREVPDPPAPAAGEVTVRVRAAGLNRADLLQRQGAYPPPSGFSPNIPGLEFAGEIAALGETADLQIGNRVFGITAGQAQAELLTVDQRLLTIMPTRLSFEEAAALPEAYITADDAVFSQARLQKGETLLIHAVGSGVGLAALRLAKERGNYVIGTSRTVEKLEKAVSLGLDKSILAVDSPTFSKRVLEATGGRGADVVLDLVGGSYFAENIRSLAPRGRVILVGLTGGRRADVDLGLVLAKRAKLIGTVLRSRSVDEKALAVERFASLIVPLIADGRLGAHLDKVFPAREAAAAHRYLESNSGTGKVVLTF